MFVGAIPTVMPRPLAEPPGGVLIWIVIAVELATFALGFGWIAAARRSAPEAFADLQAGLDPGYGLALTVTLVTSGALAAQGVVAYRERRHDGARRWFVGAGLLGIAFLGLKALDWASVVSEGHTLGSSDAWDLYLLATGFHAAHVVVGVGLLLGVAAQVGRAVFEDEEAAVVGSVAFWHLCDAIWFFLFPLLFARSS